MAFHLDRRPQWNRPSGRRYGRMGGADAVADAGDVGDRGRER
jgi:hypothetical protein